MDKLPAQLSFNLFWGDIITFLPAVSAGMIVSMQQDAAPQLTAPMHPLISSPAGIAVLISCKVKQYL